MNRRPQPPSAPLLGPARDVAVANRHPRLSVKRTAIARIIAHLDSRATEIGLRSAAIPTGELSIVFLTDPAMARLHHDFLDDPSTTDVITFDGDPRHGLAGEICVSADTAAAYAEKHGRDFSSELTLYIVHGWLHLAGHGDLLPAKKRAMRRAESRAMRVLQREGAVPNFSFRRAR